jgi:hypothetical protein
MVWISRKKIHTEQLQIGVLGFGRKGRTSYVEIKFLSGNVISTVEEHVARSLRLCRHLAGLKGIRER